MQRMRHFPAYLCLMLSLAAAASCGTSRKAARQSAAPVILPLVDSSDIAASRERAKAVLDSIDRVRGNAAVKEKEPEAAKTAAAQKAPGPEDTARELIAYARSFTGTPYKLGARGPSAFDCSSYTSYVYAHFGYSITPYSQAQFREGREVPSYGELQCGDLVFFGKRAGVRDIGHVGIVVFVDEERGSFRFIHASVSKGVVEEDANNPYFQIRYIGARRFLPDIER